LISDLVDVSAAVEKPSFVQQLCNAEVLEGSGLCLSCTFTGRPKPQIQWTRNNLLVLPSAIYRVCINAPSSRLSMLTCLW